MLTLYNKKTPVLRLNENEAINFLVYKENGKNFIEFHSSKLTSLKNKTIDGFAIVNNNKTGCKAKLREIKIDYQNLTLKGEFYV